MLAMNFSMPPALVPLNPRVQRPNHRGDSVLQIERDVESSDGRLEAMVYTGDVQCVVGRVVHCPKAQRCKGQDRGEFRTASASRAVVAVPSRGSAVPSVVGGWRIGRGRRPNGDSDLQQGPTPHSGHPFDRHPRALSTTRFTPKRT